MPARLLSLDVLRLVACVLVIVTHVPLGAAAPPPGLAQIRRGGWVGVDLFFVLSGYLVSGLLFREYLRRGSVDAGRFLVRRGLKLYPAFYAFLAATLVLVWWRGLHLYYPVTPLSITGEALFLQNYLPRVWNHTWSLAVEEHFYLAATLAVWLLGCRRVPQLCWLAVVACPVLRAVLPGDGIESHLRADSLAAGVLVAHWHAFRPDSFAAFWRRWRRVALPVGVALLSLPLAFDTRELPYFRVWGFSTLSLGAVLVVGSLVTGRPTGGAAVQFAAWLGSHSYSVYLWHMPVVIWAVPRLHLTDPWLVVGAGVAASLAVGVAAAKLVEIPILRLRDRLLPARSAAS
jgi:peptidoglycan/LPS O-acetylase OafA/YrhL